MALPRFHPRTIEAVKERADIVDVVGEHVLLKKKGREFVGLCPFHDDSSPSMTVSPAKQIYYCFSWGAGGNAIKFLMELQRASFSDVVLELARRYQLPVETLEGPQQERLRQQLSRRDQLHRVLTLAAGWFAAQLRAPEGGRALAYLKTERGLSEATLADFQLGYAPDRWDGLLSHLSQVEGFAPDVLEAAGLVVARKGGDGFYDRFRQRVMVPIRDRQGRVIGFGGRALDGGEPKYLNSPETEVFAKGQHLFALDRAADSIRRADVAVVVEGYFDAISLHAAGVTQAVAALGTALSQQQITQLCRCCESKRLVLNFDADRAGVRAAERAIGEVEHLALQGQLDLRVLQLPDGKDADDYLRRHGAAAYHALLEAAPLWLDWQIEQVLAGRDLSQSDQFQQAVAALVALLGKLPQSAVRSRYLQTVAERLSGGQARLALQLEADLRQQVKGQRWHGRSSRWDTPATGGIQERAEAQILRLYLHCPQLRGEIRRHLRGWEQEDFCLRPHRRLWAVITELEEAHLGSERLEVITRSAADDHDLADLPLTTLLTARLAMEDEEGVGDDRLDRFMPLLEPSELQRQAFHQPLFHLRGAVASRARLTAEKRCRHLLDAWQAQRLHTLEHCLARLLEDERDKERERLETGTSPEGAAPVSAPALDMETQLQRLFDTLNQDALRLQAEYYAERRHLRDLDQHRRTALADIVPAP
ncbi:MAG: DNA primase [Cyanobacteriota bacterium]|nr:DNA primase [Cyanobacteriota bacterium]